MKNIYKRKKYIYTENGGMYMYLYMHTEKVNMEGRHMTTQRKMLMEGD